MTCRKEAAEIIEYIRKYEEGKIDQETLAIKLGDYLKKYGSPIIYKNKVVFAYVGFATKVSVIGDWNGWDPKSNPMERVGITPVFYLVKEFPLNARLEYKLVVDNKRVLDPYNPLKSGACSELRMPLYKPPEFLRSDIVEAYGIRGNLRDISHAFEGRRVIIYTPPGYEYSRRKYPLLIVNEGIGYLNHVKLREMLDYAILSGEIAPILAVLVDADKKEYVMNREYTEFLAYRVTPHVTSSYRVDHEDICILGASLGGLASLFSSLLYPDIFSLVISQSGVFLKKEEFRRLGIRVEEDIFDVLEKYAGPSLKVFLEWGIYEHVLGIDLAERNMEVFEKLKLEGFNVEKLKVNQGHNWINWRDSLLPALKHFFAPK